MENENEQVSELRQDLINRDWVVISKSRGRQPEDFKRKTKPVKTEKKNCPFEDLEKSQQRPPVLAINDGVRLQTNGIFPELWSTAIIANKFPILSEVENIETTKQGEFYETITAGGFCELVITRDHEPRFHELEVSQIKEMIEAYQLRYLELMDKKFVSYISIFHNCGNEAAASQSHNHSQIITSPLIDKDLSRSLAYAKGYFEAQNKCPYCEMAQFDKEEGSRLIYENEHFYCLAPFASKSEFEMIITPKKHNPNFEEASVEEKTALAEAFKKVLNALDSALNGVDYNFYLHTAPCDNPKSYPYYHWHFTIVPVVKKIGGFEMATRLDVNTIEPEVAAQFIKKHLS